MESPHPEIPNPPTNRNLASITHLLLSPQDDDARRALWTAVYSELKEMARRQLAGEALVRRDHATSLVHEMYPRLKRPDGRPWANRAEFFAAAANLLREIRVDDARKRKRLKRGGGQTPVSLDAIGTPAVGCSDEQQSLAGLFDDDPGTVIDVHEALDRLAAESPRMAEVVKYRFFAQMTVAETAEAMGISERTVNVDMEAARAWLFSALKGGRA